MHPECVNFRAEYLCGTFYHPLNRLTRQTRRRSGARGVTLRDMCSSHQTSRSMLTKLLHAGYKTRTKNLSVLVRAWLAALHHLVRVGKGVTSTKTQTLKPRLRTKTQAPLVRTVHPRFRSLVRTIGGSNAHRTPLHFGARFRCGKTRFGAQFWALPMRTKSLSVLVRVSVAGTPVLLRDSQPSQRAPNKGRGIGFCTPLSHIAAQHTGWCYHGWPNQKSERGCRVVRPAQRGLPAPWPALCALARRQGPCCGNAGVCVVWTSLLAEPRLAPPVRCGPRLPSGGRGDHAH